MYALPSLAIKMDACTWSFKPKLVLTVHVPGTYLDNVLNYVGLIMDLCLLQFT